MISYINELINSLTLFCRFGLQRAEMRILATPACPYLAAVCRGVSPYCKEQQNREVQLNRLVGWFVGWMLVRSVPSSFY